MLSRLFVCFTNMKINPLFKGEDFRAVLVSVYIKSNFHFQKKKKIAYYNSISHQSTNNENFYLKGCPIVQNATLMFYPLFLT